MIFRLNVDVIEEKVEMLLDAGGAEVVKAALRLSVGQRLVAVRGDLDVARFGGLAFLSIGKWWDNGSAAAGDKLLGGDGVDFGAEKLVKAFGFGNEFFDLPFVVVVSVVVDDAIE